MDEHFWWAAAALLVGGLIGFLLGHLRAVRAGAEAGAARSQAAELGRQIQSLEEERRNMASQLRDYTGELATEKQKAAGLEESRTALKAEFEILASSILEDKSKRFTEQSVCRNSNAKSTRPMGRRARRVTPSPRKCGA
jgi:DNA anti-recombination protein RmuC